MQIQPAQQLQTPTVAEEVEFMQTQPDLFNFQECMDNIANTLESKQFEIQLPASCRHESSEVQTRLKIANAQYAHTKFSTALEKTKFKKKRK